MIPDLYNPPRAARDFQIFSFANADHHRLIAEALLTRLGITLTQYPLDPIPTVDVANWARRHQTAHNDVNVVLGVAGVDLTDLDPRDKERLEAWIELHASEHQQWAAQTGVF